MKDSQIRSLIKSCIPKKHSLGDGLYLRTTSSDTGFFLFRYTFNNKRKEISLGQYGHKDTGLSLVNARAKIPELNALIESNKDPLLEKKRSKLANITTLNDIADDWLQQKALQIENPQSYARVYNKDIAPKIGMYPLKDITTGDLLTVIRDINSSGRPTIANDALQHLKNIFKHAIKFGHLTNNPAISLDPQDAGGSEKSRERALSLEEIEIAFKVFRNNAFTFTRDNYLCTALLLVFCCRKSELTQAPWSEFDLDKLIWHLPKERTKTKIAIDIPIPNAAIPWLNELKNRYINSKYLFPSRKQSKRPYISDDTLNHAMAKLFGKKVNSKNRPSVDVFKETSVTEFVPHDLRRTGRSLLAEYKISIEVAERCLNHKLKGVLGIYNKYDYFEERKEALNILADKVAPLVNSDTL